MNSQATSLPLSSQNETSQDKAQHLDLKALAAQMYALYKHRKFKELFALVDEYMDAEEVLKDEIFRAKLLIFKARSFIGKGRYQESIDVLRSVEHHFAGTNDYDALSQIYGSIGENLLNSSRLFEAEQHLLLSIGYAEKGGEEDNLAKFLTVLGNVYLQKSEFLKALEYYERSLQMYEKNNDKEGVALVEGNLAIVYVNLAEYQKALQYDEKILKYYHTIHDRAGISRITANIGIIYDYLGEFDKALEYYNKAILLQEEIGDKLGVARTTGNLGIAYAQMQDYEKALAFYEKALVLHKELHNLSSVGLVLGNIGNLYAIRESSLWQPEKAEEYILEAIEICQKTGAKNLLLSNYEGLSKFYAQQERWKEYGESIVKFYELREEIRSENVKKQAEKFDFERKIAEEKAANQATKELLHKTLPPSIVERMMAGEEQIADYYESVSILFADVVGFTKIATNLQPKTVLKLMNFVFATFDEIGLKYGCERIKTVGDGYIAICGAPIENKHHAISITKMALEMLDDITLPLDISRELPPETEFEIRIGLHCGEITAGVIGSGKLAYDIYGDAVNIASRMESHGDPDTIHASEHFVQILSEQLVENQLSMNDLGCAISNRGSMIIKGKGAMETYFLKKNS